MTTAEKIYSASTSEDAATARLAEKLARQIEDDIASQNVPVGGVMGSLRELSERYSVGRAAIREAVALLERRGLGRLRPGPCGGFIVAQPDAESIGSELANFFRISGVSRTHLDDARAAVDLMTAGLAASACPDDAHISRLQSVDADGGLDWHLRIRAVLAELTGEPVIKLFIECLNDLTIEFASVQPSEREWREDAENYVKAVQRVLTAGEPLAAMAATEKLNDDLDAWLRQDDGQLPLPSIEIARQADDRTLATFVARKIAVEVLRNRSAGRRLGSEWDLCERFSVGRLTLRQAIRQLQDSGLVECRRGRGNGLVVRDLRGTGSIRLVLAFLISRQMDPTEAGAILFQLNRFVPALAVSRANNDQRAKLEKLVSQAQQSDPIDRYDLLRLVQYVSQLADSPIIDLFSRCLAAYEARFHPLLAERLPASVQAEYFDLLRRLLNEMDPADQSKIEWAKHESSKVMLTMSRTRPL